jgi:hypothetical protein
MLLDEAVCHTRESGVNGHSRVTDWHEFFQCLDHYITWRQWMFVLSSSTQRVYIAAQAKLGTTKSWVAQRKVRNIYHPFHHYNIELTHHSAPGSYSISQPGGPRIETELSYFILPFHCSTAQGSVESCEEGNLCLHVGLKRAYDCKQCFLTWRKGIGDRIGGGTVLFAWVSVQVREQIVVKRLSSFWKSRHLENCSFWFMYADEV